jgi:hypothetical protein
VHVRFLRSVTSTTIRCLSVREQVSDLIYWLAVPHCITRASARIKLFLYGGAVSKLVFSHCTCLEVILALDDFHGCLFIWNKYRVRSERIAAHTNGKMESRLLDSLVSFLCGQRSILSKGNVTDANSCLVLIFHERFFGCNLKVKLAFLLR